MARITWEFRPGVRVEVEASSVKGAVEQLSEYAEVFGIPTCGSCSSKEIAPQHRINKGLNFYELKCRNCGATQELGQHKEGDTLFPRRGGWVSWQDRKAAREGVVDDSTLGKQESSPF